MTHQQPGQWLASKLIGTTVVGPNNESIGDVNDVLMERDGHAAAVIVGVGGFLGIGEKDVAISFDHIELTSRGATNASTAQTTGSTSATSQSSPSTTGSTASTTANGVPDRIMLRMTKQELQNAPKFTRADQRDTVGSGAARPPLHRSSKRRFCGERGGAAPPLSAREAAGLTDRHIKKRGWVWSQPRH